jgi:hypothetical protein
MAAKRKPFSFPPQWNSLWLSNVVKGKFTRRTGTARDENDEQKYAEDKRNGFWLTIADGDGLCSGLRHHGSPDSGR